MVGSKKYINVELVSESDQFYNLFLQKYKTEKPLETVVDSGMKCLFTDIGYLIEKTIKYWVSKSKYYSVNNIIKFDSYQGKGLTTRFKEIDYVKLQKNCLTVGEIKTTIDDAGNISDACRQFLLSKDLLFNLKFKLEYQFIWVDLNLENDIIPFDNFEDEYNNVRFNVIERNGLKIEALHFKVSDVFLYGVRQGIIKSPELLDELVQEMRFVRESKMLKGQLKELESITSEKLKKSLESQLTLINYQIELLRNGFIKLNSEIHLAQLINVLGSVQKMKIESEQFVSFSRHLNYVFVDDCADFKLLSANALYLRIPLKIRSQSESLIFKDFSDVNQQKGESFPFIDRSIGRKFFKSTWLENEDQANLESYKVMQRIINNSEGIRLSLLPGEFLIFDNHKMLHKRI